jgi:hypothetical protein
MPYPPLWGTCTSAYSELTLGSPLGFPSNLEETFSCFVLILCLIKFIRIIYFFSSSFPFQRSLAKVSALLARLVDH